MESGRGVLVAEVRPSNPWWGTIRATAMTQWRANRTRKPMGKLSQATMESPVKPNERVLHGLFWCIMPAMVG